MLDPGGLDACFLYGVIAQDQGERRPWGETCQGWQTRFSIVLCAQNSFDAQVEGVWGTDVTVVLAGLTNTYSSYVTTFEEYAMQRYEGASTIFGPHTLDAYIQVTSPLLTMQLWADSGGWIVVTYLALLSAPHCQCMHPEIMTIYG